MASNPRTIPKIRREIDNDLMALTLKWEDAGMPMLGSMLRIIGFAYRNEIEGSLESLMDSWLWAAQKMELKRALTHGQPLPEPDERARTPQTARRHQRKYELLAGAAARERRIKEKRPSTRRR